MTGPTGAILRAGGGGLGTGVASIREAIDRAWSEAGVAILVDLGGAETNSEMAIEMLDDPLFYLSGPPEMLAALSAQLRERGVPEAAIRTDAWE